MKWSGKIGNNVEASLRLNGILLSKPIKKCRCGEDVDLNEIAEEQAGLKLTQALHNLEGKLDWDKKWNVLSEKVVEGKVSLDGFFKEHMKLLNQYHEKEWGLQDASYSADAVCPKCLTTMGKVSVTLRLVNESELKELTKKQLVNLEPSNEILAHASKRLNFGSVDALKAWLNDSDAEKAKQVLQNAIVELEELDLSYDASMITGELRRQIGKINEETQQRRMELVNAVERIVKERTHIIK